MVILAVTALLAGADPPPAPAPPSPPRAAAPPPASALAGEGFSLLGEDKGVKVYRREKRPGIELAAEGNLAASPDRVRRVLIDYPSHQRWQKHLKENRILARGDGFLDVYQRLDLPVIDDRDFTLHVTWGDDGGRRLDALRRGQRARPRARQAGVVRVTQHEGGWRLEPIDGGTADARRLPLLPRPRRLVPRVDGQGAGGERPAGALREHRRSSSPPIREPLRADLTPQPPSP